MSKKNKPAKRGSAPVILDDGSGATGLPPDNTGRVSRREMHIEQTSGYLPPPSMLKGYDDVVANGAERLFRMAERASEDNSIVVRGRMRNETWGMWLGFVAFAAFLGVGLWLILNGYEREGILWVGIQFGSTVFVRSYGHKILVDALKRSGD